MIQLVLIVLVGLTFRTMLEEPPNMCTSDSGVTICHLKEFFILYIPRLWFAKVDYAVILLRYF